MKPYIKITLAACVAFMVAHCAQSKPSVDIKVKPSFQLQDGSPLSLAAYDEYSPQLVQRSDGKVTLFFVSNRPAVGVTCPSAYTIFITTTTTAYTGGALPPFEDPVTVQDPSVQCLFSHPSPFKIAAYYDGTYYRLIFDDASSITSYYPITGIASSSAIPDTFTGSNHRLLGIDAFSTNHEIFTMDGSQIYYTKISESPTTAITFAGMEGMPVESIASIPSDVETNGFFFLDHEIGMGTKDDAMALPHLSLSLATARYLMDIQAIAVLKSNTPGNEVFVFSGKSEMNGDATHDLYTVRSFTARELWQMGVDEMGGFMMGGGPPAPLGPIAFLTPTLYKGNLGGATAADGLCESEKPPIASAKTFKAFVFDSGRYLLSDVLQATTTYYQPDGQTPWFSTDGSLKITSIDNALFGAPRFWTGLSDGNPTLGDTCQNWTDSSSGYNAHTWDAAETSPGTFTAGNAETCDNDRPILCIEQP